MVEEGLFPFFGGGGRTFSFLWFVEKGQLYFFLSLVRSFSPCKICMSGIELFRLKHNFDEFIEASRAIFSNAPTARPLKSEI